MVEKKSKDKCNCKPLMGVVALVLSVVGIYSIVLGLMFQFSGYALFTNWPAMLAYLVGVCSMTLAKMSKYKAYGQCAMHKM